MTLNYVLTDGTILDWRLFGRGWRKLLETNKVVLIGVDGCGGSGKSTFADRLKQELGGEAVIVHHDDFYLPSGNRPPAEAADRPVAADFDWQRLESEVLLPLSEGRDAHYRRYDWWTDSLAEWIPVPAGGIVIVEGVYTLRRELTAFYDYKIWIETPRSIRLSRGLARDGEEARDLWENRWMIDEETYVRSHNPAGYADLILSGSGTE